MSAKAAPYEFANKVHSNFPQIIEQNFARMNSRKLASFMHNVGENELSDLAQLYVNAVADAGKPARLLGLLALRMTPQQLGRMSNHFGFAPIYASLTKYAPEKSMEFQANSNVDFVGPVLGGTSYLLNGRFTPDGQARAAKAPWYQVTGYTIPEIYLDLRTAPIGALGIRAALYETFMTVSGPVQGAWWAGFAIGTGAAALMSSYAPDLYDTIGGTIDGMIQNLNGLYLTNPGLVGPTMGYDALGFQLGPLSYNLESTGGDFAVVDPWAISEGYAGGGC